MRALKMKHSQHLAGKFCLGRCRGNALGFAAKRAADVNSEVWVNFHIHLYYQCTHTQPASKSKIHTEWASHSYSANTWTTGKQINIKKMETWFHLLVLSATLTLSLLSSLFLSLTSIYKCLDTHVCKPKFNAIPFYKYSIWIILCTMKWCTA